MTVTTDPQSRERSHLLFGPRHRQVSVLLHRLVSLDVADRRRLIDAQSRRLSRERPRAFTRKWQRAHGLAMECARRNGRLVAVGQAWAAAQRLVRHHCRHDPAWAGEMLAAAVAGEVFACVLLDVLEPAAVYELRGPWFEAIEQPEQREGVQLTLHATSVPA